MVLYHADCSEQLPKLDDNSVDTIITDPPYGLGSVKDLPALLKAWMTNQSTDAFVGKTGFLGKTWDKTVPSPAVWKQCLRILKPGGYLLAFAGTRTQDLMGVSIRLGGFQLRDEVSYFGNANWLYGTGYPKNQNLKPSHEPILVFRKEPEGTVAQNLKKWRVGSLNTQECRKNSQGRWPANSIFSHLKACENTGTKQVKSGTARREKGGNNFGSTVKKPSLPDLTYADASGKETVIAWKCAAGCPVDLLGDAARFFYCPKPSKQEKNAGLSEGISNNHPTVKPQKIIQYLCKLVTPVGGVILDPFMGSGSTGVAATKQGYKFIGIEKEKEYFEIAQKRIGK
jgi:site-specific DNA-methyltransferase (adenine-specific)